MNDAPASRLAPYLERIGVAASPAADSRGLEALQRAHRQAIAFENLDIRLGRPIRIDSDSVFDKLVVRGRGGYCFEHNRLFADMLAVLGVASRPLLARVRLGLPDAPPPPRTHVLLLVGFPDGDWIADVGFGGSYVPAMPLADGAVVATADGASHRLRRVGEPGTLAGEWLLERAGSQASTDGRRLPHDDWQPQYSFDLAQVAQADLEQANHWTSTAASSRFTNLHIATIALPGGFASLVDGALKVAEGDRREEAEIADVRAYRALLASRFRLPLSEAEALALPLFGQERP